ncbi:7-carboxy-7-deazaguanine synthase QueE [Paraburkholderia sp. EG304]|uniref:7-carboxy-7-deazaguanine synthase QueE n=1 Tax=Paraburkholderia sp. EG304 TaxID=3237015 RepID=UPI00397A35B9
MSTESAAYPVNETFESLQGEGSFTGTPAVLIRLQGCDVGCPWCDTKQTWRRDMDDMVSIDVISAKTDTPVQTWAWFDLPTLGRIVGSANARHVVISGGEPCAFDLRPLIALLQAQACRVQVETSGTYEPQITPTTFLTVSPKFNMPGGRLVLPDALMRADELKYPVGKPSDIERVLYRLEPIHREKGTPIWLQPLSQSSTATALCIAAAQRYDWRVSLQTHRFIGIR